MSTIKEEKFEPMDMKRSHYSMIINGERTESTSGETFTVVNPATGEEIATVAKATNEDAEKAILAARQAFDHGKWRHFPVNKRSRMLNKIASIMRSRFNELVELEILDTGKSIAAAQGQVMQAIEDFEFYAGAIVSHRGSVNSLPGAFQNHTEHEPVGVCAQIIPWNYPLMMAAWKVAPAIATGCSVVVKPASLTPLTAIVLGEICIESGVPAGVVNIVPGSGSMVGNYLVDHEKVDKVAFTGSTPVGKSIMERASATLKRVTLELGGKSPSLIFEDADIDAAVDGSLFGIFYNSGQSCEARSRIYIQESIYDEFMEKFISKTKKLALGDPFSKGTHVGAIINQSQLEVIDGFVKSAKQSGAVIEAGGAPASVEGYENGYWYEPTVISNVTHDMDAVKEEIFGPVAVVMKFKDEKEAVALANDSIYGLGSAVWTKDHARATRVSKQIQAGIVMVNCPFSAFPGTPFGGYKQSGFGRELCVETLDLYCETKSIVSYYGPKPLNPLGV
ncbi:aldehyde dehydrogenase family protein [Jeotgalibacillus proteolyticus]|uniref:Betaine-aldehyde dehydrogenase n=1 Tax=Jeotgalibacillus proteolyticus TaxID=2082395 RepID=A0A2S5GGV7_9BACL|nr:aldehyde dehydrogenase family protein [Jeotgalibacillus proteolyticus]PPA72280.1 betaine-aldehyde dehydrogenase [Jeotgalibacillus proteolyticus]